jgi:putative DNA primase/helicase
MNTLNDTKIIEKIQKKNRETQKEWFKKSINTHQKNEITEEIVNIIKKKTTIITTRNDEHKQTYFYDEGIYKQNGEAYIIEEVRQLLDEAFTVNICNNIINKIQADTMMNEEELYKEPPLDLIAVKNGILNIKTRELYPFTPSLRFFNKLPVNYNDGIDCPNIKQHLKDVLKHETDTHLFQELAGYTLLRSYKYENAFMLSGNGRNGKSKTLDLLRYLLGHDNCSSIQLITIEKNNFILSEFHKKLANIAGDLSHETLKYTGSFKSLTGRDVITADRKFKSLIKFENYAKMIFACNEIPRTTDLSYAFFARWIILDFPYTFVDKEEYNKLQNKTGCKIANKNQVDMITTPNELTGLLNYALDGLKRLNKQQGFSKTKTTEEIKQQWMRKSDSFAGFCMDCVEENYNNHISKRELRRVYSNYCRLHKLKQRSEREIKQYLEINYGVNESKKSVIIDGFNERENVWEGIKFKDDVQPVRDVNGISPY